MLPLNQDIHATLYQFGYVLSQHPEYIEEVGNCETGPMVNWCPAYDEYTTHDSRIIIDQYGHVVIFEDRDLAVEAYCDEMAAACCA